MASDPDLGGAITPTHGREPGFAYGASDEGQAAQAARVAVEEAKGIVAGGARDTATGFPTSGTFDGLGATQPPVVSPPSPEQSYTFNEGSVPLDPGAQAELAAIISTIETPQDGSIITLTYEVSNDGTPLPTPGWYGGATDGAYAATDDRAILDAGAAATAGTTAPYNFLGTVTVDAATVYVYATPPGVGVDSGTGAPVTDIAPTGFVGGVAGVALPNAPEPVPLVITEWRLNGQGNAEVPVYSGPPYPDTAAVYVGYVTTADSPPPGGFAPGWNVIAEYDSNQDGALSTAADYYNAFDQWAPAGLLDYSGFVGTETVTNPDDSSTVIHVFMPFSGLTLHTTDDSSTTTIDGGGLPGPPDPTYPTLTATNGWNPDNATTFLTPTDETFDDTGTITLPNALKNAVDEMVTLASNDGDLLAYTGIAIPYLTTDGSDGDPATWQIEDFGLTDAWAPDLMGALTYGYGLTTDDVSDNDPQQMAVDMGLDPSVWGYLGKFNVGTTELFVYTTIPGYFGSVNPVTGAVTTDSSPPADANTGTWSYTALTGGGGGGGGHFPANYTYDTNTTIADPGSGKFRFSTTGALNAQWTFAISATDFNGNNLHDLIIGNNPPDSVGPDGIWKWTNQDNTEYINDNAKPNAGGGDATGYLCIDHTTWVEITMDGEGSPTTNLDTNPGRTTVDTPAGP